MELDESQWDIIEGSWEDILSEVRLVRIRSEHITGDEFILFDNINLSFSPVPFELFQDCTTFESIELGSFVDVEGWAIIDVDDYELDPFGFPENSVKIFDQLGALSFVAAPPKYHGDWSSLEGAGTIEFDLYVDSDDVDVVSNKDFIFIENEGNSAKINLIDEDFAEAINGWQHFVIPIDEFEWQMTEGEWTDLLENVTSIRIDVEFIVGNEIVYFDNFCISDNAVGIKESELQFVKVYPNPSSDFIVIESKEKIEEITIYNSLGSLINLEKNNQQRIDVSYWSTGIYLFSINTEKGNFVQKVAIE